MCGCEAHWNGNAHCTCVCPEHENKRAEYALRFAKHRADAPLDSCSKVLGYPHGYGLGQCLAISGGSHKAEAHPGDSQRARKDGGR